MLCVVIIFSYKVGTQTYTLGFAKLRILNWMHDKSPVIEY